MSAIQSSDSVRADRGAALRAAMLTGPVVPTMLRLGLPTLVVLIVQTLVGVMETYYVSFLGIDALAGVALVFPVLMLMQMMANGGIGGGVSSAMARALGSGRRADADAIAAHTILLGVAFGAVFMVLALLCGPMLYRVMGGTDGALATALTYSNAVFYGAIPLWVTALLASALRGAGNVQAPARVTFIGALVMIPLSALLIFGWGPVPAFGVAGAGIAVVIYYTVAALVLIGYVRRGKAGVRFGPMAFDRKIFADIMGVGALSALGTVQSNLTVGLATAAVGVHGTEALAGYGIASRLDYLLIPLLFGFGTALVTMVGTALGAGDIARARRVMWIGAALGAGSTGIVGLIVAMVPTLWAGLFTSDATVLASATLYLRTVAPFYAFFGAGMMLYFASQGANRILGIFLAGTARLVVAGLFGWIATAQLGVGLAGLYTILALALIAYGISCFAAVLTAPWARRVPALQS